MELQTAFDVSYFLTFLGGTAVGAAGTYFADLFTDRRKAKDLRQSEKNRFARLQTQMPKLFAEMRLDLKNNGDSLMREFVILSSQVTYFQSERNRFVYYESEHPNVCNQADLLAAEGCIQKLSSEPRIYRFNESFVKQILNEAL